jgi:hypothetical protein
VERVEKDLALVVGHHTCDLIKLRIKWYGQRTPVDLGINAYHLSLDAIVSDSVLGEDLTATAKAAGALEEPDTDGTFIAPYLGHPHFTCLVSYLHSPFSSVGHTWLSIHLLDLEGDYDHVAVTEEESMCMDVLRKIYSAMHHWAQTDSSAPEALKQMTFDQFSWWLAYAMTHPSNWAWDRLSIEINRQ